MDNILTLRQAADYLKVGLSTLYALVNQRKIPAFKVGGQWRLRQQTLESWLDGQGTRPGPRVLVVDDEESVCNSFKEMSFLLPYGVVTTQTGEEAIDLARQGQFDLVFLDLKLPGMNGVEVFRAVKKFAPSAKVVVITSTSDEALLRQALEMGPFMILRKPVSLVDIETVVQEVVRKR